MAGKNSPFVYGKIATADSFTDREADTEALKRDFLNLTNVVIISPRRWGKSSLVRKVSEVAMKEDKRLKVCHLDIFNVRDEDEFYGKFAASIIKGTSSKVEEIFSNAMKYAASIVPVMSMGDPLNPINLEFRVKYPSRNAEDILDMAEKIAEDKNLRIMVCIDEFQQIATFGNPEEFQARLRSHWQLHGNVAYCLYGSRRHMMTEVFTNPGKPFYKFGKTIFLEKIPQEKWLDFIADRFLSTGKSIGYSQCGRIVELADNNPYYIQQISEEVWNRTADSVDDDTVNEGFMAVVRSQAGLNLALTQTLSIAQQNLLHAIVDGNRELSSSAVMEKYSLKNSLTVQRAKKSLMAMDIIDNFGKSVTMEDPIYAYWLKTVYFGCGF